MSKFEEESERWLAFIQEELIARTDIECSLLCIEMGCVSYAYNGNTKSCLISDEPTNSANGIPLVTTLSMKVISVILFNL